MFKTLFKKLGFVPEKKSAFNWGSDSTIVNIDQFTSNLLYNANYGTLAQEGYVENVISSTCIEETSCAVANLPFTISIGGEDIDDRGDRLSRSFKQLIKDPNADYNGWDFFMESVQSHRMIADRAYIYPQFNSFGEPDIIEFLRPDRVSIVMNQFNTVGQYQYTNGTRRVVIVRDEDQRFDLIDLRNFNPLSDTNGLSPLIPAGISIDSHTEANRYNKQIVQNGAKPSGMISIQNDENSGHLDESEIKVLQDRIKQKLAMDNGGLFFMNANAKFEPINFSNSEMDWLNGIKANAISICNRLKYHPFLLGLESTTFTNMDAAIQNWYETSVIPAGQKIYDALGSYYSRKLGVDVEFKVNEKKILALALRFKEKRSEAREDFKAGIISQNEAREEQDREPTEFGDDIFVDQNNQPMQTQVEG